MTRTSLLLSAGAACVGLLFAAPASAQDEGRGWTVTVGPGAIYKPKFPGADEMGIGIWPIFSVRRSGTEPKFATPDDSFGISLVDSGSIRLGPAANIDTGRDEDDAIEGLGDINWSIEGGAFAEAFMMDRHFRLRGEVRKGFGGHKGLIADLAADAIVGSPSEAVFSIGPRARFTNGRYNRSFFGIDEEQSLATGLPEYDPDGGLYSAGALAFANYQFSRAIGIRGYARYDRLMGDAKDSPIVQSEIGSRNQYEVGLGMTFTFDVN
jgi:outer membrane protein